MIQGADRFVPLGAAGSEVQRLDRKDVLALLVERSAAPRSTAADPVLTRSFAVALLEALERAKSAGATAAGPASGAAPLSPLTAAFARSAATARVDADAGDATSGGARDARVATAVGATGLPHDEGAVIRAAAERAGVDAGLLTALRRAENGGPGREFGVLSVPAPSYDDQVRIAADSIRKNMERFESATGRLAVDAATGRYTDEFIRFFSNRWAPVGADNDPGGLNRHHAQNLTRLYAKFGSKDG